MGDSWKTGILWSCIYNKTVSLEFKVLPNFSIQITWPIILLEDPISTLTNPASVKDYHSVQQHLWNHHTHIQSYPILKKNPQETTVLYLLDASHITGEQPALVSTMAACPTPLSVGDLDNCYCPHHFRANFCLNITLYIALPATC